MSKISRRSFLDSSAKISAGAVVASSLTGAAAGSAAIRTTQGSPNDKINVALIGCGGMGKGDLGYFLRLEEVDCLAVADVDKSRIEEGQALVESRRGKKPDGYQDFRKIIDRNDIDVVIVGTPDHWHAIPTIYACETGKDVYVEKPLATSIEEGRAMVTAARRNNRVVQVGTQQRSAGHFARAVEIVQSGQLGKIRQVRAWAFIDWKGGMGNPPDSAPPAGVDYDMWLGPTPKRPFNPARFHFTFRWFWDYSGGLMTDWGAHMVDVVMWAMKEDPVGAMAMGGKYGYPDDIMETPDTQQSIIEFPSFSCVWEHMVGCGVGPWQREHGVEFHGQNGILVVDRGGWEILSETDSDGKPRQYRMKPTPRQGGSSDYHFTHVKNFVDCVKSRQQPTADVEVGHKSVIACHLGNIAARLRTQVTWDPKTEQISGHPEAKNYVGREYRAPWTLSKA
ncbi:MAG: Gfo/Idh/MocA family oxidoreductase [Acidobacteriota bacterium]|nr:MAG: Gfo/Idh/MocA family oxidoreductase [Acidobacteriota bacterium]